ncbi:MAG: serine/threonine protein kinase [Myxococcales bacterium]|nr:serine/threonine protein kinase [Myxococcales bacterium]
MTDAPDIVRPGQVIDDKFEVERLLGRGGMGVVVQARHLELDQRVAIKLLKEGVLEGDEAVQRFTREARALAKLGGEHVVRVTDVGRLPQGTPYMVMEYLDGEDLSASLRRRGPLPPDEVADYLVQACAGLAEAHATGLVHRDLKPANLFLARRTDGTTQVKVLDFGIAKSIGGTRLTADFAVLGSPRYMSPEQLRAPRSVDARTDIWALGAIAFRLLTDKPPFEAEGLEQLMEAMLAGKRPALAELRPGLPPALVEAVERCLRVNPEERFASVAELARALAELGPPSARERAARLARASSPAPPEPAAAAQAATVPFAAVPEAKARPILEPTLDDPALRESVRPSRARTPRWAIAAGLVIVASVALVVAVLSGMLGATTGWLLGADRREVLLDYDPKRVDPVTLLPQAAKLAAEIEPGAELVSIEVDPVVGGWVDVTNGGLVYFAFQYGLDGGKAGWVEVTAEDKGLSAIRHSMPPRGKPVARPTCSVLEIWRAVTAAGVPPELPLSFGYGTTPGAARWRVEAAGRPELRRSVDGTTCKVVQTPE